MVLSTSQIVEFFEFPNDEWQQHSMPRSPTSPPPSQVTKLALLLRTCANYFAWFKIHNKTRSALNCHTKCLPNRLSLSLSLSSSRKSTSNKIDNNWQLASSCLLRSVMAETGNAPQIAKFELVSSLALVLSKLILFLFYFILFHFISLFAIFFFFFAGKLTAIFFALFAFPMIMRRL